MIDGEKIKLGDLVLLLWVESFFRLVQRHMKSLRYFNQVLVDLITLPVPVVVASVQWVAKKFLQWTKCKH